METAQQTTCSSPRKNWRRNIAGRRVVNGVSINVAAGEDRRIARPERRGQDDPRSHGRGRGEAGRGTVFFQEHNITAFADAQTRAAGHRYLTQEPSVFRKLSVEENILAILETCKLSRDERDVRLKYLLAELDLTPIAKSKTYQLSGGEKRRLEITRALVTSPKLLLLDEPFSGIDPIAVY